MKRYSIAAKILWAQSEYECKKKNETASYSSADTHHQNLSGYTLL